jgi:hypothetical protein
VDRRLDILVVDLRVEVVEGRLAKRSFSVVYGLRENKRGCCPSGQVTYGPNSLAEVRSSSLIKIREP